MGMQAVMRMQTVMHHDEDACGDATTRELMAGKLSAVQQLVMGGAGGRQGLTQQMSRWGWGCTMYRVIFLTCPP